MKTRRKTKPAKVRRCRVCGCTDADCSGCIARTGKPCYWVAADLCSACVVHPNGRMLWEANGRTPAPGTVPAIEFTMDSGHVLMFNELTGLPNPVCTDVAKLTQWAEAAKKTDARIKSFRIVQYKEK